MMMNRVIAVISICYFFSIHAARVPFKKLTLLNKPIGCTEERWFHPSVRRSIINGLERVGISFNLNPSQINEVGDVVWVLTDDEALLQCIMLKKRGHISYVLAGPNFVVLPHEKNHFLNQEEIDAVIVPSAAVKQLYIEDEPSLASRIYVCFSGVDTAYWVPTSKNVHSRTVLVYWKTESESFCNEVQNLLRKYGWNPQIVRYGKYNHDSYRELLQSSRFAVFISKSESQGIALAEAWAMDVPTLCWNSWNFEYQGKRLPLSSCPFLTPIAGQEWFNFDELEAILINIEHKLAWYRPRAFVLDQMSDEACAYQILNVITQVINKSQN